MERFSFFVEADMTETSSMRLEQRFITTQNILFNLILMPIENE